MLEMAISYNEIDNLNISNNNKKEIKKTCKKILGNLLKYDSIIFLQFINNKWYVN